MTHLETAKAWLEAMNAHDIKKMFSFCDDALTGFEVAESKPNIGKKAVSDSYRELFAGYPDCKCKILNAFSGDDQVLVEVQWTGTNTGTFRGEKATNKAIDIRIAYIFMFKKNLIFKITEYYDGATVAAQMES